LTQTAKREGILRTNWNLHLEHRHVDT